MNIAPIINKTPNHCKAETDSDRMSIAETIATGSSIELNTLASRPEMSGAPPAKDNGGMTAPTRAIPVPIAHNRPSSTGSVGRSRMKMSSTIMKEPVTINVLRKIGCVSVATCPLKKMNPAYENPDKSPNTSPIGGNSKKPPPKISEASTTPAKVTINER